MGSGSLCILGFSEDRNDSAVVGLFHIGLDRIGLERLDERLDLGGGLVAVADGDDVGVGLGSVAGGVLDGERILNMQAGLLAREQLREGEKLRRRMEGLGDESSSEEEVDDSKLVDEAEAVLRDLDADAAKPASGVFQ